MNGDKESALAPLNENNFRQADGGFFIDLFHDVLCQLRRQSFIVHVHKEINLLDAHIEPFFHARNPMINTFLIAFMQAVAHKPYKGLGNSKVHMKNVLAAGSIRDYRSNI